MTSNALSTLPDPGNGSPSAIPNQPTTDGYMARVQANVIPPEALLPPEGPPQWQLYTYADAYQPLPPLVYIVDGIFSDASLNIVYGAPGSLKTMLLEDMVACIVGGTRWLEPRPGEAIFQPIVTLQVPCLWVDFDNGPRRTKERFAALGRTRKVPPAAPLYFASMPTPWLDASKPSAVDQLAELIDQRHVKLVVIDNLGLITGSVDENSAEMAGVMGNLRYLAERTTAAIVIIHHQRKSNGNYSRKGETLRGHSSIEASLDLALLVEREAGSDSITVTPTKSRGSEPPRLSAYFDYRHKPGTKELDEARFWGQLIPGINTEQDIEEACLDILTEVAQLTKTELTTKVKEALSEMSIGTNKIREHLDELVRHGKLKKTTGPRTTRYYSLP